MPVTWSVQLYIESGDATCPTCANNIYRVANLGGSQYKKCEECGRISKVTEDDNLVEYVA